MAAFHDVTHVLTPAERALDGYPVHAWPYAFRGRHGDNPKWHEVWGWMLENFGNHYDDAKLRTFYPVWDHMPNGEWDVIIYFKDEIQACAFKMRWC